MKLVSELTRWPHAGTDDQVMAAWFHQLHLPKIAPPTASTDARQWRQSWMRADSRTAGWVAAS